MIGIPTTDITTAHGVASDCRGQPGKRQVTVLALQCWRDACAQLAIEIPWTARRANLLVSGMQFSAGDVGKIISIGGVQLRITGQTDPCGRMDRAHPGLRAALTPNWRGGVCCQVISGGKVSVGDDVLLSNN